MATPFELLQLYPNASMASTPVDRLLRRSHRELHTWKAGPGISPDRGSLPPSGGGVRTAQITNICQTSYKSSKPRDSSSFVPADSIASIASCFLCATFSSPPNTHSAATPATRPARRDPSEAEQLFRGARDGSLDARLPRSTFGLTQAESHPTTMGNDSLMKGLDLCQIVQNLVVPYCSA